MNSGEIKILPDGKLESQWRELGIDITFELHDIKTNSTFNLDEDEYEDEYEGLREYQGISGKLTPPFQSLHVKDESKSEKDKTIVLRKLDLDNVDIYISTSSSEDTGFWFQEYEDSIYIMVIVSSSLMESILKQIHSNDMTISLSVNFENSFNDTYAPEIYDVYLTNTKGKVNKINVSSKSIEVHRNKQDAFEKLILDDVEKVGKDTEDIRENTVKFWQVKKLADELSQQEWDNTKVTQILLSICVVLLGIILYKTW